MKQPLLSVIVPVYNVRPYLCECVDSILRQTYKKLELILVDDGSNDGSEILCDEIAKSDSRVVVIHQQNKGQSAARNAALDICNGEYLSFVDSDDYISPCHLYETAIRCIISQGGEFVQFPFQKEGRIFNSQSDRLISESAQIYNLWINSKTITNYMWDKIWRRSLFSGLRFKEGIIFEDRYIFIDLLNQCKSVVLTSAGKYFYRIHSGQTTQRRRDSFFLKSMLTADMHILDMMPKEVKKYRKTIQARMFSTFIELETLGIDGSTAKDVSNRLSLQYISSIRMLLFKLLGYTTYHRILG